MTERPSDAVDLPGHPGVWVALRAPKDLTNRQRKVLRRFMMPALRMRAKLVGPAPADAELAGLDDDPKVAAKLAQMARLDADDLSAADDMQGAFIVTYLKAWSLDRDLPTIDTVDDLEGGLYDALAALTAGLGDGTTDFGPDGALDPDSPTVPSDGSVAA